MTKLQGLALECVLPNPQNVDTIKNALKNGNVVCSLHKKRRMFIAQNDQMDNQPGSQVVQVNQLE